MSVRVNESDFVQALLVVVSTGGASIDWLTRNWKTCPANGPAVYRTAIAVAHARCGKMYVPMGMWKQEPCFGPLVCCKTGCSHQE